MTATVGRSTNPLGPQGAVRYGCRMNSFWRRGASFVGAALFLSGCQFSASASGEANTGGENKFEGEASMTTDEPESSAGKGKLKESIRYEKGKLDYEGVINFEYNKANLQNDESTSKTLGDFKKFLDTYPDVRIEVEGHTDSRGSDEYNRKLSDRRAATVRKWLVDNGIADSRVTSIGKGEDDPQVPEPTECHNQEPDDTTPCEAPWATNRRVVFRVTDGGESLPQEPDPEPTPEPAPDPEPEPAPVAEKKCKWLFGPHLNIIGPNSWVGLAGATQPCIDWLELSLGVGLGLGSADVDENGLEADGSYWSLTVPLRARFWPFEVHSPIADLGIGITHYRISADAEDAAGNTFEYTRNTTPFIGHAGLGYGYRPNGPDGGFRLAVIVGLLVHLNGLGDSEVDAQAGFAQAAALQAALDEETNELKKLEPYAELSLGWLF